MIRKILGLLSVSALLAVSSQANAFEVDYLALATNNEQGYSAYAHTDAGITVTATGTNIAETSNYYAYLDHGNAGLGVCKVLTSGNQCSPSSDDNVTFDEALHLAFSQEVVLDEIKFRNGSHGTTFGSGADFQVSIDGGSLMTFSLTHLFTNPLVGTNFTFIADSTGDGDQIYISSISGEPSVEAPIPGTALLMLGLLGFMGLRRKL